MSRDWRAPAQLADFTARLWAKDATLWSADPEHRAVAANRLGWLDLPARMAPEVAGLEAFAAEVAAEGFTRAVLLGMGGSSLAPEVLRSTFGVRPGRLELTVLDNTSPAAVRAVTATHDPAHTLFIVSSKSGGTVEVSSFEKHFFQWVCAARGDRAGRAFIAITDAGTPLAALAGTRGYRRTFINPGDIGGRYSALSFFGLVPAALIGADPGALLASAAAEARRSGPAAPVEGGAVQLGARLGGYALEHRDKLTFVPAPGLEAFGSWLEQLVAESTGKDGRGIVPVDLEPPAPPGAYGEDRVFVELTAGPPPSVLPPALQLLRDAGHPVLRERLDGLAGLGGAFLRWEIATVAAGAVLGVDPFDEPNVSEAKQATQAVLERFLADGRYPDPAPVAEDDGLAAYAPPPVRERLAARAKADPVAWAGALLALAGPGDYFALLAYLRRTPAVHERLQRLRLAARAYTHVATTLGYGPRFLHSTGQLHKGGPATGVFLQLTADEGDEVAIPGEPYGFGALRRAQAAGDFEVLARRGRRVVRIHLGAAIERGLDALVEGLGTAVRA